MKGKRYTTEDKIRILREADPLKWISSNDFLRPGTLGENDAAARPLKAFQVAAFLAEYSK